MAAMTYSLLVPSVIDSFAVGPIPEQWRNNTGFIARISYGGTTIRAKPSDNIIIPIVVENKGTCRWDSHEKQNPVHISYHLMYAEGNMIAYDNIRTSFTHPIESGESRKVDLIVTVPSNPARYLLEIDAVKERVTWFKNKGSLTIQIPLVVSNMENQPYQLFF
jgi:hypothetical protein